MFPSLKRYFSIVLTGAFVLMATVSSAVAQSTGIELNKRPLRDFGDKLNSKIEAKTVDLTGIFALEMEGSLSNNGRFDASTISIVRKEGDAALIEIAVDGILAINDAGFLHVLSSFGAKNVSIAIEQSSSLFLARIKSKLESPKRAGAVVSAVRTTLQMARMKMESPDATEADKKDLVLLSGLSVEGVDENVLIDLKVPKEEIHALIISELSKKTNGGN